MTRRLLLSYLSLAALVLVGLEIPLGFVYSRAERERIVNSAKDEVDAVAAFAELSLAARRRAELVERTERCAERIGGQVVVLDADGTLLAASPRLSYREERALADSPEVAAALRGRDGTDVHATTIGGVHHLSVAAPVGQPAAQGAVRITLPTDAVHARVHRVWLLLAFVGLAVLTWVAAVAFAFARWAGRPIRRLEEAAHRLADGGVSAGVPVTSGPPEVRSLAAAFNRTAARLEHLLASQRAFAGEASHQLKTPLAALRLRLENLEPAVARRARPGLAAAVTETDRLARMVEGLLAMARLEEDATLPGPVDVGEVCAERHRTWQPLFAREDVSLVLFAGSVGPVLALPGAVEQILDNLLSNALRASPAGSTVTMELRLVVPTRRPLRDSRPSWVDLHVTDEGPGMTAEQRARAFDRFWRAPGAPKGGTGLGLSLVQRLAHASGGEVTLRPAATGGLDAVVRLPSAESPGEVRESGSAGSGRRERGVPTGEGSSGRRRVTTCP
ncbi:HAMP domain-containing histidine kinase [Streptomyces spinoverrucosus]|uniref:sensor histidine kinase n=1 Tax=Streptomyces spinoverrucosus TaxID=284043 RepID=UPI0018C3AC97|nr:HAMP domain-containing sensor histidine kinase [Streptomyces spinoverrucosus]MBG0855417.1 HAMP domain-containing histidine kinase [Streptomyces spinoverrucosus]